MILTMGKRKLSKEADAAAATTTTTTTAQDGAASTSSSDIFKTLFGNVEENAAVPSIFSDSNPFKRNPNDNDKAPESESKKKQIKETKRGSDGDPVEKEPKEAPLDAQRTKKAKTGDKVSSFVESNAIERPEVGEGGVENRRKRKRNEVEREYEAKKYGVVLPDNVENPAPVVVVVGEKRKKADDEADPMVSNEGEGFDDENKLLRTIFVGNLPLKVKKKAIIKEFSTFGEIESVRIRSVPLADSKVPRKAAVILKKVNDAADSVNAYIVFKTEQSAEASLVHNMTVIGGKHIRVDRACPPRKKLKADETPYYDTNRTIFLGNLPFDVKDEEIYQLFCGIKELQPSVEAVRVVRDPHVGLGKGVAYVLFKTKEAANLAIRKRHLKLRDRELRVSHAKQSSTPSKRKSPFPPDAAKSPSKKFVVESNALDGSRSGSSRKRAISYQGLRANKSGGVQKKVQPKRNDAMKMKSKTPLGQSRQGKRPAVAARKEKAKALEEIGASKQIGKKRKFDSRTPESSKLKKKFKKSS